jgi:hypothetical protein
MRRNIALPIASAVWVGLGALEIAIAPNVHGDSIRADVCLFPVALAVTFGAIISHFSTSKPRDREPGPSLDRDKVDQ